MPQDFTISSFLSSSLGLQKDFPIASFLVLVSEGQKLPSQKFRMLVKEPVAFYYMKCLVFIIFLPLTVLMRQGIVG